MVKRIAFLSIENHIVVDVIVLQFCHIQIYLRLCDHPYDPSADEGNDANKLSKNELKKQKRMAKEGRH